MVKKKSDHRIHRESNRENGQEVRYVMSKYLQTGKINNYLKYNRLIKPMVQAATDNCDTHINNIIKSNSSE